MPETERRRIQRINLDTPVSGRLSGMRVILQDLSTIGARVEHSFPLPRGGRLRLDFDWEEETITIHCEVARCAGLKAGGAVQPQTYVSGLQFIEPLGASRASLLRMILAMVTKDLGRRKSTLEH